MQETEKIKPTLTDYVNAILERDSNSTPYSEIEVKYGIKPYHFFKAIFVPTAFFNTFLKNSLKERVERLSDIANDEDAKMVLDSIESDPMRRTELFRMEKEYIQMQYRRRSNGIAGESQKKLYPGTLIHPENRIILAYYAFIYRNKELKSKWEARDRRGIMYEIIRLPQNLTSYFQSIKLEGLMTVPFENKKKHSKKHSSRYVLELFDDGYQIVTGHPSLFDSKTKFHLKFDERNRLIRTIQIK